VSVDVHDRHAMQPTWPVAWRPHWRYAYDLTLVDHLGPRKRRRRRCSVQDRAADTGQLVRILVQGPVASRVVSELQPAQPRDALEQAIAREDRDKQGVSLLQRRKLDITDVVRCEEARADQ
jgi:hypothetical protein